MFIVEKGIFKIILAYWLKIIYTTNSDENNSIPAAPLLKSTRNPVGFCFLGGFLYEIR